MKPVQTTTTDEVYHGPTPSIGDLPCQRITRGHIRSFWRPSKDELTILNAGGLVELDIHNEPIPPVAVNVSDVEVLEEESA